MKKLLVIFVFVSFYSFGSVQGEWSYESEYSSFVLNLSDVDQSGDYRLNYMFVFQGGKRINDLLDVKRSVKISSVSDNCYEGIASDPFLSSSPRFIVCLDEKKLIWSKISQIDNSPYVPRYVIFERGSQN